MLTENPGIADILHIPGFLQLVRPDLEHLPAMALDQSRSARWNDVRHRPAVEGFLSAPLASSQRQQVFLK